MLGLSAQGHGRRRDRDRPSGTRRPQLYRNRLVLAGVKCDGHPVERRLNIEKAYVLALVVDRNGLGRDALGVEEPLLTPHLLVDRLVEVGEPAQEEEGARPFVEMAEFATG